MSVYAGLEGGCQPAEKSPLQTAETGEIPAISNEQCAECALSGSASQPPRKLNNCVRPTRSRLLAPLRFRRAGRQRNRPLLVLGVPLRMGPLGGSSRAHVRHWRPAPVRGVAASSPPSYRVKNTATDVVVRPLVAPETPPGSRLSSSGSIRWIPVVRNNLAGLRPFAAIPFARTGWCGRRHRGFAAVGVSNSFYPVDGACAACWLVV